MRTTMLWTNALLQSAAPARIRALAHDDRGEGVISAAIAVLIMAFLGAGMWLAFNTVFKSTAKNTCEQTKTIGGADNTTDCSTVGN